jgi:hypothetical protein
MIWLWALDAAAAAGLLAAALCIAARRAAAPPLPAPAGCPPTLVLVPMRDEEDNVAGCLQSLLGQTAPVRVRVIDDGSTDGTAARVAEIARREPRLELRAAGPLPAGWHGKAHALARGAADAGEPWLLLTDADTRHHSDLLARAHAAAQQAGLDAVSLAGRQEARGAEALLTPVVFALLDAMLGDWRGAAQGRGPAVANGQFILVRRLALERAGGFAAVRDAPLDDVALARALRGAGARTGFWRADGLRVRMYRGYRATFRGWRRNLATILGERRPAAAVALASLLLPPALAAATLLSGTPLAALLLWAGGAAAALVLRLGSRHPLWPAGLYPGAEILTGALLLAALRDWRRGRLEPWKGREISRAAGR